MDHACSLYHANLLFPLKRVSIFTLHSFLSLSMRLQGKLIYTPVYLHFFMSDLVSVYLILCQAIAASLLDSNLIVQSNKSFLLGYPAASVHSALRICFPTLSLSLPYGSSFLLLLPMLFACTLELVCVIRDCLLYATS